MIENCLKINYDYAKKIDAIFKKYGIECSYTDYLQKMENKYNDMSELKDDEGDRYITWDDCKKWKEKYKTLKCFRYNKSDYERAIIEMEGVFIRNIYVPKDPAINAYNKEIEWETEYPDTLEEIDQYLNTIQDNLDTILKLRNNKDFQSLKRQLDKEDKDFKLVMDEHHNKLDKIRKQIGKLIEAQNDF